MPSPDEVFAANPLSTQSVIMDNDDSITDNEDVFTDNIEMITDSGLDRDVYGRFITDQLPYPYIDHFDCLNEELQQKLQDISRPAREKKRLVIGG